MVSALALVNWELVELAAAVALDHCELGAGEGCHGLHLPTASPNPTPHRLQVLDGRGMPSSEPFI